MLDEKSLIGRSTIARSMRFLPVSAETILFSLVVGLIVGLCGGAFCFVLAKVTALRAAHKWIVCFLPLAGLPVVLMYRKGGIRTAGGSDLIVQAARGEEIVSRLLAPVIFCATVLTQMFGGSAGREGAALQLGGSLAALVQKFFRMGPEMTTMAIMCGMSAGFSAVFGNQISAAVFALEISCVGMLPLHALFPCVISSLTAGAVARFLGAEPVLFSIPSVPTDIMFYGRVFILALLCGVLSIIVCRFYNAGGTLLSYWIENPYLRIVIGGAAVAVAAALLGCWRCLGTGQSMIISAIREGQAGPVDWLLKLMFTAVTLGAGFKGGEIVPSFAIGACFGCTVGPLLGLPPEIAAAIGMITLFCGVTNCPVTSLMLGFEVFSFVMPTGFLLAVAVSFVVSGYSGLYSKQKFAFAKVPGQETSPKSEE